MSKRDLFHRFKRFDRELEKVPEYVVGVLGIPLGGEKLVEVPTRNGYVYVRLRDAQDELIQAFNDKVSPVYDLPVICEYKNGHYSIIGRDTNRYGDWGDFSSYLPRHGNTHSFVSGGGGDIVWVYSRQFMPYLAQPSGTKGGSNVVINDYLYLKADGTWRYDGVTGSPDIIGSKPTGSTAVMVLVYEDTTTGLPGIEVGSGFPAGLTGTGEIAPYIPSVTNPDYLPIAAIRLVSGTSTIQWDNIYDARQFFGGGNGGGISTGSIAIYDEGVYQGQATAIDFVGDNVSASLLAGQKARVFITGSAGGLSSVAVQDEGTPQGNVTTFNFVGDGVIASVSGTVANIDIPAGVQGPAGVGGLMVWNEGVPLNTGTIFNFVGANVDASISGSVINVFVTGSAGGGSLGWTQTINEDGSSYGNFTTNLGNFLSDGTVIMQTGTAASTAKAKYNTIIDTSFFVYEAEIQIKSAGVDCIGGLVAGYPGTNTTGGMLLRLNEGSNIIEWVTDGVAVALTISATINVDTWYKVRMVVSGGIVSGYLDGVLVGTAKLDNALDESYVGLMSYQAVVWWRNIKLWNLSGLPA